MNRRFVPMSMAIVAFFLFSSSTSTSTVAASSPTRDLDDANFEHLTQASTGQTTGNWLVAFAPHGGAAGALRAALDAVSAASSRAVLTASVDTSVSKATATRFSLVDAEGGATRKAVLLFKDRMMHEFTGSLAPHEGLADELLAFAMNPSISSSGAKVVPRPATAVDAALAAAKEAVGPLLLKLEELAGKVSPAIDPVVSKIRPHLERAGISGNAAAVGGLVTATVAAVAVALAGKKAAAGASSSSARGRAASSSSKKAATRQSARRSTTKRA